MKKLITAVLTSLTCLILAQNKRFVYEYKLVPDSTNRADIKSEIMHLDVTKEGSRFYSYTVYQSDSSMRVNMEKQLATKGSIEIKSGDKKGFVKYSVIKDYPDYKVYLNNRVLMDQYKVLEDRKIVWKVESEKQKIANWNAQKAVTTFGGRVWTAWFSQELPIQDGPCKFHGLPGLIVKVEDQTHSHLFELKAIKNLDEIKTEIFKAKEIAINQKQYAKVIKDYENDPTKGLKQMQMGNIVMQMKEGENRNMKEQEQRLKSRMLKDNNKIELSLN